MKWNQDIRKVLYSRLYEKFGPCSEWHSRGNPTGELSDYNEFLKSMAVALGNLTGNGCTSGAVLQQIQWGIQEKQSSCLNTGAITNFIYNRAISLEAGLIKAADMPNYALFERK